MDAASVLEGLTDPQREAVAHVDGPLLVLAGPGSGKTTVVTRRIAHLVAQGIPAWQILALTFTNKAAGEMRERVERLLPEGLPGRRGLTVSTFHAFCARLLRRFADAAGLDPRFAIWDASDQRDAVKRAIKAADLAERNFSPGAVAGVISGAKNRLLDAAGFEADGAADFWTRSVARAFRAYERILVENDAVDFDDLLVRVARLLRDDEEVRETLRERYRYLLVDEYQDTNHAQFVIADQLGAGHRNVCVVGDPDQSIYGWRGADIRNILDFERLYPETRVVPLGRNFRSTGSIVACADALIRNNQARKHKPLHTELGPGRAPLIMVSADEHAEADAIVRELSRLRGTESSRGDALEWRDMAVLYRMNSLSRVVEDALRAARIPYVVARGTAFFERKEIKDALAYLRLVANPNDEIALRRIVNVPARGIGRTTLDRVEAFAAARGLRPFEALAAAASVEGLGSRAIAAIGKFVALVAGWRQAAGAAAPGSLVGPGVVDALETLVERVVRESGLEGLYGSRSEEDEERLANLSELVNAAADFVPEIEEGMAPPEGTLDELSAFLESVALVSDQDAIDPERGSVTLMTLHAAKGLEFDVVAMVGLEEGLLPHSRSLESAAGLEEERRLCFVGMTRARRHLLLSRARRRTFRGIGERTIESAFLAELPDDAVEREEAAESFGEMDPFLGGSGSVVAGGGLPTGCLVRHPAFGLGRVHSVSRRSGGACAIVDFHGSGRKTLYLDFAPLERVEG